MVGDAGPGVMPGLVLVGGLQKSDSADRLSLALADAPGKKATINGEVSGVAHQRVSDARAVLTYSRELAEAVMLGGKPLQAAPVEGLARDGRGGGLSGAGEGQTDRLVE